MTDLSGNPDDGTRYMNFDRALGQKGNRLNVRFDLHQMRLGQGFPVGCYHKVVGITHSFRVIGVAVILTWT